MENLIEHFFEILIKNFDYKIVLLLTILESTILPIFIPIELTLIITGYIAKINNHNFLLIILILSLGITIGSIINYLTGKYLGRPFILKYGKYFFLKQDKFNRFESLFLKYSSKILFIGRFVPIPGIKHFITLPAGMGKMNFTRFLKPTILGSLILTSFFISIGYYIGISKSKEIFKMLKIISIIVVILVIIILLFKKRIKKLLRKIEF